MRQTGAIYLFGFAALMIVGAVGLMVEPAVTLTSDTFNRRGGVVGTKYIATSGSLVSFFCWLAAAVSIGMGIAICRTPRGDR